MDFNEEKNGQYNFFDIVKQDDNSEIENISDFIGYVRNKMSLLQKLKKEIEKYQDFYPNYLEEAKKEYNHFIEDYFKRFDFFSYENILENYFENYSTDYHNLGKLFLYYLQTFIYKESKVQDLNNALCIRLENFILIDPIRYRREYLETIEIVHERKKLRVNGYIVYHFKPLLEKLNAIDNSSLLALELHTTINEMINNPVYQECIFEQGREYLEEESEQILSVLFLHYLEKCAYYNSFSHPNDSSKKMIAKIENYVIFHLPIDFILDKKQETVLEMAKREVAKRMAQYIEKESTKLFVMLKDYDQLETFKKSNKLKGINDETDINALPQNIDSEEICFAFETFLSTVFQCTASISSENLPIFLEGYEIERNISLTLALEYLNRFVYAVRKDFKIEDEAITNLENSIASCKNFKVSKPDLCYAKSILLDRVNRRNVLKIPYTRTLEQKSLQSRIN